MRSRQAPNWERDSLSKTFYCDVVQSGGPWPADQQWSLQNDIDSGTSHRGTRGHNHNTVSTSQRENIRGL